MYVRRFRYNSLDVHLRISRKLCLEYRELIKRVKLLLKRTEQINLFNYFIFHLSFKKQNSQNFGL